MFVCQYAFVFLYYYYFNNLSLNAFHSVLSPYEAPDDRLPFDDVDPEYGLHGYTLHISLHNTMKIIMSGHFPQLSCRKGK